MPNFCSNRITLTANTPKQKSELNKVLGYLDNTADDKNGFFNQILPVEVPSDRVNVWGTRTDISIEDWDFDLELVGIEKDEDTNEYQFEDGEVSVLLNFLTAWHPCIPVVEELHKRGLDVSAEFEGEDREFLIRWERGVGWHVSWAEATVLEIPYFKFEDNKLTAELVVEFVGDEGSIADREISISAVEISEPEYIRYSILEVVEDAINKEANELDIDLDWDDKYYADLQEDLREAYNRSQKSSMIRLAA